MIASAICSYSWATSSTRPLVVNVNTTLPLPSIREIFPRIDVFPLGSRSLIGKPTSHPLASRPRSINRNRLFGTLQSCYTKKKTIVRELLTPGRSNGIIVYCEHQLTSPASKTTSHVSLFSWTIATLPQCHSPSALLAA
jgi:hypothetical protein